MGVGATVGVRGWVKKAPTVPPHPSRRRGGQTLDEMGSEGGGTVLRARERDLARSRRRATVGGPRRAENVGRALPRPIQGRGGPTLGWL